MTAALFLVVADLGAQNIKISPVGLNVVDGRAVYYNPTTEITVDVCVRHDVTVPGPYARYAQRYFNAVAPLAEKSSYTLVDAGLYYTDSDTPVVPAVPELLGGEKELLSHTHSDYGFVNVSPDRLSSANKSDDEIAAETAAAIFSLRQARMELITGRAGENVFGAGLKAALEEIDRAEEEYLSLFFGKEYSVTEWRRFTFLPAEGEGTHVVCRFSPEVGVVDSSDLSASPIVVEFRPLGMADGVIPPVPVVDSRKAEVPSTVSVRVADLVDCRVMSGRTVLAEKRIPVYQFGVTAEMVEE